MNCILLKYANMPLFYFYFFCLRKFFWFLTAGVEYLILLKDIWSSVVNNWWFVGPWPLKQSWSDLAWTIKSLWCTWPVDKCMGVKLDKAFDIFGNQCNWLDLKPFFVYGCWIWILVLKWMFVRMDWFEIK